MVNSHRIDLHQLRTALYETPESYRGLVASHFAEIYAMGCVTVARAMVVLDISLHRYRQAVGIDEARQLFSEYGINIDFIIREEGKRMKTDFKV